MKVIKIIFMFTGIFAAAFTAVFAAVRSLDRAGLLAFYDDVNLPTN